MGRKYTCKNCGHQYHRDVDEVCPNCEMPPDARSRTPKPEEEPVAEPAQAYVRKLETAEYMVDVEAEWNQNDAGEIVIVGNKATMNFHHQVVASRAIFCPKCGRQLREIGLLFGTDMQRCSRCKLNITLVFH